MIELMAAERMNSSPYLQIRCEFYDIWNRLFLHKNEIDREIFKSFRFFWPIVKGISQRFPKLSPKYADSPLTSELILRSNQLWMPRCWEYPWAILNSHLEPDTKILDIGSGWSLFPLYLAQKGWDVDCMDTDKRIVDIFAPLLSRILQVKVNYSVGDVLQIPSNDNSYDCVFCISVLEHLEEEVENNIIINKHRNSLDRVAIKELIRVIKPQGRVIITLDYGNKETNPRGFYYDYAVDLINEFREYLLVQPATLDMIKFTREMEKESSLLWEKYFPYDKGNPPGSVLGIILTKR